MTRRTICVDFDSTIFEYFEWTGPFSFGPPLVGAKLFLEVLRDRGYYILIYSCRPSNDSIKNAMARYMEDNELVYDDIFMSGRKPPATAYVDDRAVSCTPQVTGSKAYVDALASIDKIIADKKKDKERANVTSDS